MSEISDFGLILLVVAGGFSLALVSIRLTSRLPVPAPGALPAGRGRRSRTSSRTCSEDVSDPDGRADRRRGPDRDPLQRRHAHRPAALPGRRHADHPARHGRNLRDRGRHGRGREARCSDVDWTTAGIIGAALAPTDPAVTFSVLGQREVVGPHRDDPRGRVGHERPGRDRAADRDGRARDPRRRDLLGRRRGVRGRDGRRPRRRRGRAVCCSSRSCASGSAPERGSLSAADTRRRRPDLRRHRDRARLGLPRRLRRGRPRSATRARPSRPRSSASTARSRASPRSPCSSRSGSRST